MPGRTYGQEGKCSVCLRQHVLLNDHPIRHGWDVENITPGQGLLGTWHRGACQGVRFPHLGLSVEGTKWALKDAKARLKMVREHRNALESGDDALTDKSTGRSYVRGEAAYKRALKAALSEADSATAMLDSMIEQYQTIISGWKPAAAKGRDYARGKILHKGTTEGKFEGHLTPLCKSWSGYEPYFGGAFYAKRDEDVTCKACRKTMDAKVAAYAPKKVVAPKGSVVIGTTTHGWPVFGPSDAVVAEVRAKYGNREVINKLVKEHLKSQKFDGYVVDHQEAAALHKALSKDLEAKSRDRRGEVVDDNLWYRSVLHAMIAAGHRRAAE